ncbi:MAG: Bax inhibitor-1/YccA family protein [Eubacteriales bacterium]|nr:Bax inhibitor-1/YccA family protein [Eubacteriales bacterium]
MNTNDYQPYGAYSGARTTLSGYAAKTFGWMFLGLLTTFFVSMATLMTGAIYYTATGYTPFVLALAELAVVIWLSARIHTLSIGAARGLFFGYAVLNGLTFSSLFVVYSLGTLVFVFGMTALYFGIMALYAFFTKADLTRIRPVLIGGLITLLVLTLLSMFINLSSLTTGICILGVVIFVAFTAYDTQKIRQNYFYFQRNPAMLEKASIISALQLYLDFINLFLYLLRLFGRRSN